VVPGVLTPERPSDGSERAGERRTGPSCNGCGAVWSGLSACHCSACHRTFAGIGLFDRHRDQHGERGKCVDPATLTKGTPIVFRDGMWRGPEMDEATKAKRFGK
jgi:hypothetical protein